MNAAAEIRFCEPVTRLRKLLPVGYLKKAQDRLAERGVLVSAPFISNVKNGRKESAAVLDVLIGLAEEEQRRLDGIANRINALTA